MLQDQMSLNDSSETPLIADKSARQALEKNKDGGGGGTLGSKRR